MRAVVSFPAGIMVYFLHYMSAIVSIPAGGVECFFHYMRAVVSFLAGFMVYFFHYMSAVIRIPAGGHERFHSNFIIYNDICICPWSYSFMPKTCQKSYDYIFQKLFSQTYLFPKNLHPMEF